MLDNIKKAAKHVLDTQRTNPDKYLLDDMYGWSCHALENAYVEIYMPNYLELTNEQLCEQCLQELSKLRRNIAALADDYIATVLQPKLYEFSDEKLDSDMFILTYYNTCIEHNMHTDTVLELRSAWLNYIINL